MIKFLGNIYIRWQKKRKTGQRTIPKSILFKMQKKINETETALNMKYLALVLFTYQFGWLSKTWKLFFYFLLSKFHFCVDILWVIKTFTFYFITLIHSRRSASNGLCNSHRLIQVFFFWTSATTENKTNKSNWKEPTKP